MTVERFWDGRQTAGMVWTGKWDVPMLDRRLPPIGLFVARITAQGDATFEGTEGLDGPLVARTSNIFVTRTRPTTVFSGQGQARRYVPALEHLFTVRWLIESQEGADIVMAKLLAEWSVRQERRKEG